MIDFTNVKLGRLKRLLKKKVAEICEDFQQF